MMPRKREKRTRSTDGVFCLLRRVAKLLLACLSVCCSATFPSCLYCTCVCPLCEEQDVAIHLEYILKCLVMFASETNMISQSNVKLCTPTYYQLLCEEKGNLSLESVWVILHEEKYHTQVLWSSSRLVHVITSPTDVIVINRVFVERVWAHVATNCQNTHRGSVLHDANEWWQWAIFWVPTTFCDSTLLFSMSKKENKSTKGGSSPNQEQPTNRHDGRLLDPDAGKFNNLTIHLCFVMQENPGLTATLTCPRFQPNPLLLNANMTRCTR